MMMTMTMMTMTMVMVVIYIFVGRLISGGEVFMWTMKMNAMASFLSPCRSLWGFEMNDFYIYFRSRIDIFSFVTVKNRAECEYCSQ